LFAESKISLVANLLPKMLKVLASLEA
jgi:hypothetical protein